MRPRPARRHAPAASTRTRSSGRCRRWRASACSARRWAVGDASCSRRRPPATPRTARPSSRPRRRPAACRIELLSGAREARAFGARRDLRLPRARRRRRRHRRRQPRARRRARRRGRGGRHHAARRPRAAGHERRLPQEGAEDRPRGAAARARQLGRLRGRTFYAVGGTWRALAQAAPGGARTIRSTSCTATPIDPADGLDFLQLVERVGRQGAEGHRERLRGAPAAPRLRRHRARGDHPARPAGASVAVSALGVREGLLFDRLDRGGAATRPAHRRGEPTSTCCAPARPATARSCGTGRTASSRPSACRRRRTSAAAATPPACSPTSAGGRIPTIAASRASTSSPTRPSSASTIPAAPISRLSVFFRHEGLSPEKASPRLKALAGPRLVERARLLGALMRVAYPVSVAMEGVLPRTPLVARGDAVVLQLADRAARQRAPRRPRAPRGRVNRSADRARRAGCINLGRPRAMLQRLVASAQSNGRHDRPQLDEQADAVDVGRTLTTPPRPCRGRAARS